MEEALRLFVDISLEEKVAEAFLALEEKKKNGFEKKRARKKINKK
jgi:hypothetical protein